MTWNIIWFIFNYCLSFVILCRCLPAQWQIIKNFVQDGNQI